MKSVGWRSDDDEGREKENIVMTARTEEDEDTQKERRVAKESRGSRGVEINVSQS